MIQTPTEKAAQMVEKFDKLFPVQFSNAGKLMRKEKMKACAVICVVEIMLYYPVANDDERSKEFNKYWQQVKEQILLNK